MPHYAYELALALAAASLPALLSLYFFFITRQPVRAIVALSVSAFLLRLVMAGADPYLHPWDERYHALVAKHMMDFPFRPMMRLDPILPYDAEAWCCNHIWVHKQPLFLWQMAASMKVFGVNELALRLPSVIMGALSTVLVYDIGKQWLNEPTPAFIAAFLFTCSDYNLGLVSGQVSLDHNDLAFAFYVTASSWALVRHLTTGYPTGWAIAVGVFVGCAVLNKWLTGFLTFGGWGLYLLLTPGPRTDYRRWGQLLLGAVAACAVFLPWQVYILREFPRETAIMHGYNYLHIFEALDGHKGSVFYHLVLAFELYGRAVLLFALPGVFLLLFRRGRQRALSWSLFAMVGVIYLFFSILVKTKMPAFPYPVFSIVWIAIGYGMYRVCVAVAARPKWSLPSILGPVLVASGIYSMNPQSLLASREPDNPRRNALIHNTDIYRNLSTAPLQGRVILNVKGMADTELMFYQDVNAYHFYPRQPQYDSLRNAGYHFAAFRDNNRQVLPAYLTDDPDLIIIDAQQH